MSSATQGLAHREGLESLLVNMSHTGPLAELRRGPQACKSGDPHSQDADRRGVAGSLCNWVGVQFA